MEMPEFCRADDDVWRAPDAVTLANRVIAMAIQHGVVRDTPDLQRDIARNPVAVAGAILVLRVAQEAAAMGLASGAALPPMPLASQNTTITEDWPSPPLPQPRHDLPHDHAVDGRALGALPQHR